MGAGNSFRGSYWHQRMLEQGVDCHVSVINQLAQAMSGSERAFGASESHLEAI